MWRALAGRVAPDPIDREAEDLGTIGFELRERLTVDGELIAADRAPIRRIKGKDHRLAGEIAKFERPVSVTLNVKSGALVPD